MTVMSVPALTCSAASAIDEPLPGTAAQVATWLCVEQPGGWGRDIIADGVLGQPLSAELGRRADAAGVRPMLIRRPGRVAPADSRTVLLANSMPDATWCERLTVTDVNQLLDLDLSLLRGPAPGLGEPVTDPVILVCTHSKRDQCCALLGRPIAAGLARSYPDLVWECSHTGGHRFAPSLIVLPTGYTYGRVDIASSAGLVAAAVDGEVATVGLRGRSCYPAAGQVAEVAVRQTVPARADDLTVDLTGTVPMVRHRDGRRWAVTVTTRALPPRPASCGAAAKPVSVVVAVDVEKMR